MYVVNTPLCKPDLPLVLQVISYITLCSTRTWTRLEPITIWLVIFESLEFYSLGSEDNFVGSYFHSIPTLISYIAKIQQFLWIRRATKSMKI